MEWKEARGDGERERGCSSYIDFTSLIDRALSSMRVRISSESVGGPLGGLEISSLQQAEV